MTVAIGDEIRDSSALAEKMNDSFDNTRVRLRGTWPSELALAGKSGWHSSRPLAFYSFTSGYFDFSPGPT
jgi:hypothetical protein